MNELEFSQFRRDPSPEFAESLYRGISARQSLLTRIQSRFVGPGSRLKVALVLVVTIFIVAACARQVFSPRNVQVGDFWVQEVSEKYICVEGVVFPSFTPSSPLPTPQPQPGPPPRVNLDELKALLDFELRIPAYSPEGFSLQEDFPPPTPFAFHSINWIGPEGKGIGMLVFPRDMWPTGREFRIPRVSWEEATVRGASAVVIHGRCGIVGDPQQRAPSDPDPEFAWIDDVTRLNWSQDEVFYELIARDMDIDVLIEMAESAR